MDKPKVSVLDRLGVLPSSRVSVKDRLVSNPSPKSARVSVKDRLVSTKISIKDRLGMKRGLSTRDVQDSLGEDDDRFDFDDLNNEFNRPRRNVEIAAGPTRSSIVDLKSRVKLKRPIQPVPLMSLALDAELDPTRKIVKRSKQASDDDDDDDYKSRRTKSSAGPLKLKTIKLKKSSSSSSRDGGEKSRERRKDDKKKSGEEELEERIRRIKTKNAAINKRQREIDEEKKRYGCS